RILTQESCGSTLRSLEGGRKARRETDTGLEVLYHCGGRRPQLGERRERHGEPPQELAGAAEPLTSRSTSERQSPREGVWGVVGISGTDRAQRRRRVPCAPPGGQRGEARRSVH